MAELHLKDMSANARPSHDKKWSAAATKRKASEISEADKENGGGLPIEKHRKAESAKEGVSHSDQYNTPRKHGVGSEMSGADERLERPKTPEPSQLPAEEEARNEKTPGRVGPMKEEDFSLEPDIKPFKGPKGHKVRKTRAEKDEEYKQFARENEGHAFHELHVCYDKGPNGSPTYDKQGFELDYHKVADWMKPSYVRKPNWKKQSEYLERSRREERRMAELFFEDGCAPTDEEIRQGMSPALHWRDRVSKDLGVPWHKVGVREFEVWNTKGFPKAKKGEWMQFSEEARKRVMGLLSGASLRK